ncbi:hypothetical protein RND71_001892 [Anisodus tanguticus]|uniref:Uncharacterized protein n=1 Tax=Anisodus tanguticus TaxID=243964 RepID=A0AAE1T246_9SOLA|nr:hypothetical protein RND71_001892 [Anisodus tanguticus]
MSPRGLYRIACLSSRNSKRRRIHRRGGPRNESPFLRGTERESTFIIISDSKARDEKTISSFPDHGSQKGSDQRKKAGLVPFRRPPFIYLDVKVRQAPGKSRFSPNSISAGILLLRGLDPSANYSLLCFPRRAFGEEHCFEGEKELLKTQSLEATGVLSSNDACGMSHSHPKWCPDSAWLVGKRFT